MKILNWYTNEHYAVDHVGQRTLLIDGASALSAATQLHRLGYPSAFPSSNFTLTADNMLVKEGAPPLPPAAYALHLGETIYIYPAGYVVVVGLNGGFTLFHVK